MEEVRSIVLDFGSSSTKAGFAGEDAPSAVFSTVLGRPKHYHAMIGINTKDCFVGDEAQSKRGIEKLRYPIERGIVTNFDDYEKLFHHTCYNELRIAPEEHPFLFSQPIQNPLADIEKKAQIIFETFSAPACAAVLSGVLSLLGSGRGTGIVVESGHGVTQIIPIYESAIIDEAIIRVDTAGQDVTELLRQLLLHQNVSLPTSAGFEVVQEMKQKVSYVALNYDEEYNEHLCSYRKTISCEIPDGSPISVGFARTKCCEVMFQPALLGKEHPGLHKLVYESIMRCPIDIRKDLFANIILSGGNTLTSGLTERLQQEISLLAPPTIRCKVVAPSERKVLTWVGGSITGSLSSFQSRWFSKEEYDEEGPRGIHRRGILQTQNKAFSHLI